LKNEKFFFVIIYFVFDFVNPIDITMFSFPSVAGGGFTAWKSNARTFSRYYMSTVMRGGYPKEGEEYCCTRPFGMWISGFLPSWPSFSERVHSHIQSLFPSTIPSTKPDHGSFSGVLPKECVDEIPFNPSRNPAGTGVLSDHIWVEQKSDGFYLRANRRMENYQYLVYDVSGKILNKGDSDKNDEKVFAFASENRPSGIYIIHIYENGVNKIFKVFKSN
jgi:hypothetical protein